MSRAREDVDLAPPANVLETDVLQHPAPLCIQQSTGYSARPKVDVILRVLWHFLVDDDVADLKAAAGLEYAKYLAHDADFIRRKVDDAVADHDVDAPIFDGQLFHEALANIDVREPEAVGSGARPLTHRLRHVDADDAPSRSYLHGRLQRVESGAAADI